MTGEIIDWENIKWGSFTKQFKQYKATHPKSKVKDLDDFAKLIVANPTHYQPRTLKRARFYLNVLEKKGAGKPETDSDTSSDSDSEVGGKLSFGNLRGLLNQSYESKHPKDYMDFEVDKELSGQRVQVYKNPKTGQVVVSHRGTQGIHDIGNDLKYALGFDLKDTKRYKHAEDIQRKAEAKYGAENITTTGHSLGAKLARDVGQNSKEVIQLNPAYNIPDIMKKTSDKTHTIRTKYDPVSFLQPLFNKKKNVTTIESESFHPLKEHTTDVLAREDASKEVGQGLTGMGMKQLKSLAKTLPKHQRPRLTGIKKADLVAHLHKCSCGGAFVPAFHSTKHEYDYYNYGN